MIETLALWLIATDVVFIPDAAEAPIVVISVENAQEHRTLAFAVNGLSSGAIADEDGTAGLLSMPTAPRGSVLSEKNGTISVVIDDAGPWQDSLKAVPSKLPAMAVPGDTSLRIVVDGAVDGVGLITMDAGSALHKLIRGQTQEYLLYAALSVALLTVFINSR